MTSPILIVVKSILFSEISSNPVFVKTFWMSHVGLFTFCGYLLLLEIKKRKKWKCLAALWQWIKTNDERKILRQVVDFVTFLDTTFRLMKYIVWIRVHHLQSNASVQAIIIPPASSEIGASVDLQPSTQTPRQSYQKAKKFHTLWEMV